MKRLHAALAVTGVAGIAAALLTGLPSPDASATSGPTT
ncbi:hypothetical protein J2S43_002749 [Catenuloplanes nepalensis]|uniref:Uncharacterized protein n=1 Tax=Catenuloplanes nepalensis TaxID=587533 RepID=A0ABT9MS37_9ACTN|nr:hypothetical protein [Catenuloplanes nepalensis]